MPTDKLPITEMVSKLEKDYHYELKYNGDLILENKKLKKEWKEAIDCLEKRGRVYDLVVIGCTLLIAILILIIVSLPSHNQIEENNNVERISRRSPRFQFERPFSKVHCTNSLLRGHQKPRQN